MANQLLVNPYPDGFDSTLATMTVNGSIQLVGSSVSTGEPINWNSLMDAVGYNEINYRGNGKNGTGTAQTTGFAVSAGTCTCTAANNFSAGQQVTFLGNTGTLSALFNGQVVTILTATSSQFTFATTNTGTTTTGDVGLAVRYVPVNLPVPADGAVLSVTVSAISASAGVVTVTGTNNLLPGATVTFAGFASGTLGPKLIAAGPLVVASATASAFTIVSALTGTTGTGTATGSNAPQPFSVKLWSELASGYTYAYSSTTGVLYVQQVPASSALTTAAPQSNLAAAAYPSGVLGDVIKYEAKFRRG
jgi:hypothetical protein